MFARGRPAILIVMTLRGNCPDDKYGTFMYP
jgi:hypothetical protein